ncbi:hypothetical protein YC2023_041570 [Brassica napus]
MGDTAANCLILLSVGECVGGGGESRVFRCKTCNRASHRKLFNNSSDEQSSLSSGSVTKNTKKTRLPICGLENPMGQALGGHMRKHRNEKALVIRSFFA